MAGWSRIGYTDGRLFSGIFCRGCGKGHCMVETLSGEYSVKPGHRFGLVVAEFNRFITAKLAEGAVDCLLRHGAKESQITQVLVPGAFEIPLVAREMAKSGKYTALICLGCVIR